MSFWMPYSQRMHLILVHLLWKLTTSWHVFRVPVSPLACSSLTYLFVLLSFKCQTRLASHVEYIQYAALSLLGLGKDVYTFLYLSISDGIFIKILYTIRNRSKKKNRFTIMYFRYLLGDAKKEHHGLKVVFLCHAPLCAPSHAL